MTTENLVYSLAGLAVGFALGMSISVRWSKRDDGADVVRLGLSSRWQRMFFAVVGVLALFSVATGAITNQRSADQTRRLADLTRTEQQTVARQTFCNQELIRVINANAGLNADDRSNLDQLLGTISEQVLTPDPDPQVRRQVFQDAFRKYQDTKTANAAARKPYPPPDCGK